MLEPMALGLLAAPSPAGAALAVAVLALFLTRRPLRLWRLDKNEINRGRYAGRLWPALAVIATLALLLAGWGGGYATLWPLLLTLPAAVLFVIFDLQGEARAAAAELAGTTAFALLPLAFGTLAGMPIPASTGLAAAMVVRLVPTVLVMRAYLRGRKGQPAARGLALGASLIGAGIAAILAASGIAPLATPALALLLLVRASWLLGPWSPRLRAPLLGALESTLGAGYVLTLSFS